MEKRNSFIISKGFRNYFRSMLIFMVGEQVCLSANMIFVGQMVSPQAFAALDLAIPVEGLISALMLLLISGASLPASRHIGNQDFKSAARAITVAAISAVGVSILVSALALLNIDSVVSFLSSDAELSYYLKDYLFVYFLQFLPMSLASIFILIAEIYGRPDIASKATIVSCVLDVALDVILLKFTDLGAAAVAWADLVGYLIQIVLILFFLYQEKSIFRFQLPKSKREWASLGKENIQSGVSYCIPNLNLAFISLVANYLVLNKLGTEALFVWGVAYQVLTIVFMFLDCIGGTVLVTMGSMLVGFGEMDGLKVLVKKCLLATLLTVGPVVALVVAFPELAFALFGENSLENPLLSNKWLRIIVLFSIPYSVCVIKAYLTQTLERRAMSSALFLGFVTLTIGSFALLALFKPEFMFLGLTVAGFAFVFLDLGASIPVRMRHPECRGYFLIPDNKGSEAFYESVPYTYEGLDAALLDITKYLNGTTVPEALRGSINLCCEELAMSLVKKNIDKGDGYFFDISIVEEDENVKVSIKDAGKPFNPVRSFDAPDGSDMNLEDETLSLRLVNVLCKDLTYNYMYGQNAIFMNFSKKS